MKQRTQTHSRPAPGRWTGALMVLAPVFAIGLAVVLAKWKPWQRQEGSSGPPATNLSLEAVWSKLTNHTAISPTNAPLAVTNVASLLNEGTALLFRGEPEAALQMFEQAMKLNPNDEEIHFNIAFACARLGRTNDAMRAYGEALRILPDYAEAHINLGNLLVGLGRHPEGVEHFTAALKVNPESSTALNNLGRSLAALGQTKEAVAQFSEAIRLNPDYLEARFNLANAQFRLENFDEAISHYEHVLKMEPGFTPAQRGLDRAKARKAAKQP